MKIIRSLQKKAKDKLKETWRKHGELVGEEKFDEIKKLAEENGTIIDVSGRKGKNYYSRRLAGCETDADIKKRLKLHPDKKIRKIPLGKAKQMIKEDPESARGYIEVEKRNPVILAHESGHSQHSHKSQSSKFFRTNHNIEYRLGKGDHGIRKNAGKVSAVSGFISGYRAGKDEDKDTLANKALAVAPSIVHAPKLIEEADASRRGYKMLKKVGMSKEGLKHSRKSMAAAFGTYAIQPATHISAGLISRGVGKAVGKAKRKKEEKEKENVRNN